ncbi:hypothetical protein ES703_61792 [subsurface metagenome]
MSQEKELKRIADAFEKIAKIYEDPTAYLENLSQQISGAVSRVQIPAPRPAEMGAGPALPVSVTGVELKLSEEERKAICERAMADIEEQMTEFKGFIGQALSELPAGELKRIGELIKKGEKFKLRRRHGCIYLDFGHGDDDFHLRI